MPVPRKGEPHKKFVSRCIRVRHVAVCNSMYKKRRRINESINQN